MDRSIFRALPRLLSSGALVAVVAAVLVGGAIAVGGDDTPTYQAGAVPLKLNDDREQALLAQDIAATSRRTAGDNPLDSVQVGQLDHQALMAAKKLQKRPPPSGPMTFNSAWTGLGPNPIVQAARSSNTFTPMSGRIGALAIRPSNGQFILGGAQGGIWLYDPTSGTWAPQTDHQESLAIGALAVAPSSDSIVYAGTGEGALSGDSMYGAGILRSTDGGNHWANVSGDYFVGESYSLLFVDPRNPIYHYSAILRGQG